HTASARSARSAERCCVLAPLGLALASRTLGSSETTSKSGPQQVAQRRLELGMVKLEAGVDGAPRHRALAARRDLAELVAEPGLEGELGHRNDRGAPQHASERLRELPVGDRVGRGRVVGAGRLVGVHPPEQQADLVVDVDPGHVLATARERTADPELEGEQELLEQPVLGIEHQPGAGHHDADPDLLGLARGRLPRDADLGVEGRPRLRGLVDQRLAAVAVITDARLADERPRARVGGADRIDQVLGRPLATVADAPLRRLRPALADRLSDQVDDAVDALDGAGRRALGGRIPSVPGDGWIASPSPLRLAAQPYCLVPARQQRVADGRPEKAAGTGYEYAHWLPPSGRRDRYSSVLNVPVSSETRAMPSRRASSTTAAATAGATSRSKTLGMM